jgi:hypothetical protein
MFALWLQFVFEEIGKIRFNSVKLRKNSQKWETFDKVYKPQN